jgi:hypothetical protein
MAEKKRNVEVVHLLFIGMKINHRDGKKSHQWLLLNDWENQNNGDRIAYDYHGDDVKVYAHKKPWLIGLCGGEIVALDHDLDSGRFTVYPDTARLVGQWRNEDQLAEWQSAHKACQLMDDTWRSKKSDVDLSMLEPLKSAYWKLSRRGRNALLVRIFAYLEGKPIKKQFN